MVPQDVPSGTSGDSRGAEDRQLRLALLDSEARFRNVIVANADGVVVVLGDGVIAFANPAASNLLGRPVDDLIGHVFGLPVVAGETTEVDIPRGGGEPLVAELRVAETEWEGRPALLASLRDVTERKRLEAELRRKAEALAEADRRKDEFLAMLAHELRNPLAPILNAAQVMRLSGDDPAVLARMRDVVEHQVRHLARLVDDLLDVSRLTRGKVRLRREPVDLSSLVARVVEAARPVMEARRHELTVDVQAGPLRLEADPTRLGQVLANLLDNAAKYTDPGGTVHLWAGREGDEVVVKVRDDGIGISAEMLPRVFDMFAQADCSLDRSRGGLGIGLTLVKSLVAMHGGSVHARSDGPGRGCEVVVRLPAPKSAGLDGTGAPPQAGSHPEVLRHILVVDDNQSSADSLALLLQLSGHDTRVAYSGPEALDIAAAFRPDVVLLDIGLPEMDGFEVARRLREREDSGRAILVAVTGYGQEEVRQRAKEVGFDNHLLKPLDLDALLSVLNPPVPGVHAL
jgi:signal transduction histidine kinase/ActR/RegA family two-component response regulator